MPFSSQTIPHVGEVQVQGDSKNFSFEWAQEYSPPDINYQILRDLAEHFGTEKIDLSDTISEGGCETCDYGSKYGFHVIVEEATRNVPFLSTHRTEDTHA